MKEHPIALNVLVNRGKIFKDLDSMFGAFGFHMQPVREAAIEAMGVLANHPSFMIADLSSIKYSKKGVGMYQKDGRLCLPYDKFSIVVRMTNALLNGEGRKYVLVYRRVKSHYSEATDGMRVSQFDWVKDKWVLGFNLNVSLMPGGGWNTDWVGVTASNKSLVQYHVDKIHEGAKLENLIVTTVDMVRDPLTLLNSVSEIPYKEAPIEEITLQQAAKQKPWVWEYKVLKVKELRQRSEWQGGHHASPKFHKRKGHPVTFRHPRYKNCRGQTIYVESTVVGKLEHGVVDKDYEV